MPVDDHPNAATISLRQLSIWFVAGYLTTFVATFLLPISYFDGHGWHKSAAWQFYQLYLRNEEVRPGIRFASLNESVLMSHQGIQVFMSLIVAMVVAGIVLMVSTKRTTIPSGSN